MAAGGRHERVSHDRRDAPPDRRQPEPAHADSARSAARSGNRLRGFSTRRCGAVRDRAARGGSVHDVGLLQGSRPVERSSLLPLQQLRRARGFLGRGCADRRGSAGVGAVGLLRPRLPARGDREPVPLQDRAGALRGIARGDARARRPHRAHVRDRARRVDGALPASRARGEPVLVSDAARADSDGPVVADAGVPEAHGAGGVSPRSHESRRSGRRSTAGRKGSCGAGTSPRSGNSRSW